MGDGYTSLIKLRVTPEQKAQLEQQVGTRKMSAFIRERLFGTPINPKPAESRTSPGAFYDDASVITPTEKLQRTIRLKMGQGKTSKLAEIEAREELGL